MKSLLLASSLLAQQASARCSSCEWDGPSSPGAQPAWLAALKQERTDTLKKVGYTGGVFDTPELAWTQTSYIQPQSHPYDRYFYDPAVGYTVDRFLGDLTARYGGIDSVLMWPTYTNIGIDDRSQFDLFEAMPGGIEGVKRTVNELHTHGTFLREKRQ